MQGRSCSVRQCKKPAKYVAHDQILPHGGKSEVHLFRIVLVPALVAGRDLVITHEQPGPHSESVRLRRLRSATDYPVDVLRVKSAVG